MTEFNDDETDPFPFDTNLGSAAEDPIVSTAPLTRYRLLLDGTDDAGNLLRVLKGSGLVEIRY